MASIALSGGAGKEWSHGHGGEHNGVHGIGGEGDEGREGEGAGMDRRVLRTIGYADITAGYAHSLRAPRAGFPSNGSPLLVSTMRPN